MQSRLISLSGIDGSGKSTQINLIEKALKLENKKLLSYGPGEEIHQELTLLRI